jgi:hypothetical protein
MNNLDKKQYTVYEQVLTHQNEINKHYYFTGELTKKPKWKGSYITNYQEICGEYQNNKI